MKPIVIGIAGGSASGKTSIAKKLKEHFSVTKHVVIIRMDDYYKDQSSIPMEERLETNYDHPFAFDNELLIEHLNKLLEGLPVEKPIYDFEKHNRKKETITVWPREIIILEGLLILNDERIRELLDIKIFVDTDSDVRVIRRIMRDIRDRGRTLDSVVNQYMATVRPAHLQFIEPTKRYADIIIPEGGHNKVAIDIIITKINSILKK